MTKSILITISLLGLVLLAASIPPPTPETEEELGKRLFFDPLLSRDQSISCASCHRPEFAFADNKPFSLGVDDQLGTRNTPSSMNMLSRPYFFYDGRALSIQEQVLMPIHNPIEMDLPIPQLLERLNNSPYKGWFENIYNSSPDSATLSMALASFIFSLESKGDAPIDRWNRGDTTAMTLAQQRGHIIFNEKGRCFDCHFSPDFTGDEFRNIGLFNGSDSLNDVGRFAITNDSSDLGKLKVPGLRNITATAPYMHNGMFQTLKEVVDYYDNPSDFVSGSINIDTLLQSPLNLTDQEKADLIAFLHTLTDPKFAHFSN